VFLSGGLDSSLIAAIARDVRAEVSLPAYTLRFDDVSYDEGRFAQRVADLLGMDCSFVRIRPDDFPREIRSLGRLGGEPLADPAWVPTSILARRARRDVKMVLVGEGGDELFGGYPTYPGTRLADWFSALPHPVRAVLSRVVQALPVSDRKIALSYLVKKLVAADGLERFERHLFWTASTPPDQLRRLGLLIPPLPDPPDSAGELLDRLQLWDLEMSLAEGLLAKADRAGMGSALEYRAPFLDLDVLEFAATLSRADRVSGVRTKVF